MAITPVHLEICSRESLSEIRQIRTQHGLTAVWFRPMYVFGVCDVLSLIMLCHVCDVVAAQLPTVLFVDDVLVVCWETVDVCD